MSTLHIPTSVRPSGEQQFPRTTTPRPPPVNPRRRRLLRGGDGGAAHAQAKWQNPHDSHVAHSSSIMKHNYRAAAVAAAAAIVQFLYPAAL